MSKVEIGQIQSPEKKKRIPSWVKKLGIFVICGAATFGVSDHYRDWRNRVIQEAEETAEAEIPSLIQEDIDKARETIRQFNIDLDTLQQEENYEAIHELIDPEKIGVITNASEVLAYQQKHEDIENQYYREHFWNEPRMQIELIASCLGVVGTLSVPLFGLHNLTNKESKSKAEFTEK